MGSSREAPLLVRHLAWYQLLVLAIASAATLLISATSVFSFGYRSSEAHIALETAATLISALAAYLLYGRFRQTRVLGDLLLAVALTLLTCANLAAVLSPAASTTLSERAVWVPLCSHLLAALAVAAAAFAPRRQVRREVAGPAALVAAVLLAGLTAAAALIAAPAGIDPRLSPASSDHPRVVGSPGLLACQLVAMGLYVLASVGFSKGAKRTGDELLGWLALASIAAAFGRLNYFLFPSGYSDWVFTGDFFRLTVYTLILVGAARKIAEYQRLAQEAAILEERRRIARDLHDGLVQDLAFIAMQASRLAPGDSRAARIAEAADYAIAGSRGAILALGVPPDEPLGNSVAALARTLTRRSGVELELAVEDGIATTPERRAAVLRVLSEAISNALRHGRASKLTVLLQGGPGLRLTVVDDGTGFTQREGGGLGLLGMRKRAEELGGEFRLHSQPGAGARVEVMLP
jgi:signal transduction histidine kinase